MTHSTFTVIFVNSLLGSKSDHQVADRCMACILIVSWILVTAEEVREMYALGIEVLLFFHIFVWLLVKL